MWQRNADNKCNYVPDQNPQNHLTTLRGYFRQPKAVARIVGLSGLGKTRLALETFRPPDNPEEDPVQQALSNRVVYIDAANYDKTIAATIGQLRALGLEGILVVDNCDQQLHNRLQKEITHEDSKLSLLTLDYTPKQTVVFNYPFIKLQPVTRLKLMV